MESVSGVKTYVKVWLWMHLVTLVAVMLQPSTPAIYFGRYSKTSAVILVLLVVAAPVVFFLTRWLVEQIDSPTFQPKARQALVAVAACMALMAAMWYFNIGPTTSYVVVRLYVSFMLFTVILWAWPGLPFLASQTSSTIIWLMVAASCIVAVIASRSFPGLLWADEGGGSNLALNWVQHGKIAFSVFLNVPYGTIYSLIEYELGLWYTTFGVSLETARLFFLLFAFVVLLINFKTIELLYSRWAGAVVTVLSIYVVLRLDYIRIDISAGLYIAIAFYFFVRAEKMAQIWYHTIVGFATAWALDGQPTSYPFIGAFALAYGVEYGRLLLEKRRMFVYRPIVYLVIGQALGLLTYISFYSFLTSGEYFLTFSNVHLVFFNPRNLLPSLTTQLTIALQYMPMLIASSLAGVIIAINKRTLMDRVLLIVTLASALIFALTFPYYRNHYLLHSLAPFALLAAGAFSALEQQLKKVLTEDRLRLAEAVLIVSVTAACLGWLYANIRAEPSQSSNEGLVVAKELRKVLPKDEKFVGIDPFYLNMTDYPSFYETEIGDVLAARDKVDQTTEWEKIAPTSVALVSGYPSQPSPALIDYVANHDFTLVRCWQTQTLGEVKLFMRNVPQDITPDSTCQPIGSGAT